MDAGTSGEVIRFHVIVGLKAVVTESRSVAGCEGEVHWSAAESV